MASLLVISGSRAGEVTGVTGELIIGRENADLTIADAEVSRRHAAVRLEGGQLEVEDLGSANGTFVNGNRIDEPVRVGGGAKIRVGRTELEVRGLPPTAGAKPGGIEAQANPIADPQATIARPILDPALTKVRPVPDPQVTNAAPVADPQTTKARVIADPESIKTLAPDAEVTQVRSAPAAPTPAAPAGESSKDVALQLGSFSPPAHKRGRGLASRSWVPTVASFGTAIAAAVGLIVYFAVHGVPS